MNNKIIEDATAYVRKLKGRDDDVPEWGKYMKLVEAHLEDGFKLKFKMPREYHYAYLRGKGMSDAKSRDVMGLDHGQQHHTSEKKKSFWKFW